MAGLASTLKRLTGVALALTWRAADLVTARAVGEGPARAAGVVLYYHAIKAAQRERFARQMEILASIGRPFPAGSPELMAAGAVNVAVTFDDGFKSVVDHALPALARLGICCTVFVPSGCLGGRPPWVSSASHPSWTERVVSPTELRELASDPLVTIGSHTITHRDLRSLDVQAAAHEIAQSKTDLEAELRREVNLFSFPHGGHTPALIALGRSAGYRRVFTITPCIVEAEADPFVVGRVAADPDDWPLEFRLKLTGAYRWRQTFRRLQGEP